MSTRDATHLKKEENEKGIKNLTDVFDGDFEILSEVSG
jgi:hypothetical protein